jgi:hypothetical protein
MACVTPELISAAKMAGRITTDAYDVQVHGLLSAAFLDLGVAGVEIPEEAGALVRQAAITYFLLNFGAPDEYDRLKRSYDEQKAQLATCTGYTDWGQANG